MKLAHLVVVILVAAAVSLGIAHYLPARTAATIATAETAYDRIKRTGVIRCGWALWPGLSEKDPNTGQLSGTAYDYTTALAKELSLKVDWAEEVGWADIVTALQSGRIDAFCSGIWANPARAREIDFVQPIYYNALYAYARADDTCFDKSLSIANDPAFKVVALDGSTMTVIRQHDFPKAEAVNLSELNSAAELLETIAMGKADLTFGDPAAIGAYIENNPGKIRQVPTAAPLRTFPLGIAIASDYRLKRMLDIVTEELHNAGVVESIIRKHEKYPGSYLRVQAGYRAP